jgi:uncharacterized protein
MLKTLKSFGGSFGLTITALVLVAVYKGLGATITTLVLIAIEIAFSFDNAVVNAKILEKLGRLWQQLFLTVGMIIAIVGMRLLFPILIVAVSAGLGFSRVVHLALYEPDHYAHYLEQAHPSISAFGGGFLLTLALYFLFNDERRERWLERLEHRLQKLGGHWWLAPLIGLVIVGIFAILPGNHHAATTLRAGALGVALYTIIEEGIGLLERLETKELAGGMKTGWAAFGAFMYLQLLDASFSFDGVLGAFAITNEIVLIVIGLGIGALWVRSLTVQLVRQKTLATYVYLEHGAHYAILALSFALFISIIKEVPDAITGGLGLIIIGASFYASRQARIAGK